MKRLLALLPGLLLTACSGPADEAVRPPGSLIDTARIDAVLRSRVQSGALVGVSALIFERGREAYFGAFGQADREAGRPMTRDTLVRIFSMTKPVTGVALMQLYEQKRFQLEDPVTKYVPELANLRVFAGFGPDGAPRYEPLRRPITIRDLMRHTAGFSSEADESPVGLLYRQADPVNYRNTLSEMAQRLGRVPLLYQPGTRWFYGPAVDVQALLVERLSGEPFDRYLARHIFEPLGMADTGYLVPEQDRNRLAALYDETEEGTLVRVSDEDAYALNTRDWPMKPGGWGLVSTLDDYARFARMLLNGGELDGVRILQPETVRLMTTNSLPPVSDRSWLPSKGQVGFGIDFAVRIAPPASRREASGEVGEFFWDGAANTLFWVDPENQIVAVLFTQYRPCCSEVHRAFRDAVYFHDATASSRRSGRIGWFD